MGDKHCMFDIIIPLPSGNSLVVAQNRDKEYEKEVFVGLVDSRGCWFQDLAIVRNSYDIDANWHVAWKKGQMEVLVYANDFDEDYTHRFTINEREDEELYLPCGNAYEIVQKEGE